MTPVPIYNWTILKYWSRFYSCMPLQTPTTLGDWTLKRFYEAPSLGWLPTKVKEFIAPFFPKMQRIPFQRFPSLRSAAITSLRLRHSLSSVTSYLGCPLRDTHWNNNINPFHTTGLFLYTLETCFQGIWRKTSGKEQAKTP